MLSQDFAGLAAAEPAGHGLDYMHEHGIAMMRFITKHKAKPDCPYAQDGLEKSRKILTDFLHE